MEGKLIVEAAPVTVKTGEWFYDPKELTAATAETMTLTLEHVGSPNIPHDIFFELDGGRTVGSERIQGGATTSLSFMTPSEPGEYVFYCSVGNHRSRGMEGKLIVGGVVEPTMSLLVGDLDSPHGLSVIGDDAVLVSQGGTGEAQPGTFTPGNGDGSVERIKLGDPLLRTAVIEGLTNSINPGGGVVGANHAVQVSTGAGVGGTGGMTLTLVAQGGGPLDSHTRPAESARILQVKDDGTSSLLFDTRAYETANNPDGIEGPAGVDSNPWRLVLGPGGDLFVSDSGANDILRLKLEEGTDGLSVVGASTYAVFEMIADNQPVPTGLAFSPDEEGVAYVALLGPAFDPDPFSEIRRLEDKNDDGDAMDAGENELFLRGPVSPTDVAVGPDGMLYFLQMFLGTLSRVDPACFAAGQPCEMDDAQELVTDLYGATALAFLGDDVIVSAAEEPSAEGPTLRPDQVLRIPAALLVPTEPEPTPTPGGGTPTSTPTATETGETGGEKIYLPLVMQNYTRP
jgi:plastocyanin